MWHPEKYSLLQLIIQGKLVGTRSRGRPQIYWLDNLRKWFNISSIPLFRAAVNKYQITNMISNVRLQVWHLNKKKSIKYACTYAHKKVQISFKNSHFFF